MNIIFQKNLDEHKSNLDFPIIPLIIHLKEFSLREINDRLFIFFNEKKIVEFDGKRIDQDKIYKFWSRLMSVLLKNSVSEFWGTGLIKLFIKSKFILLADGWDELSPNLKGPIVRVINDTMNLKLKLGYIISTRYIEQSLSSLIKKRDGRPYNLESFHLLF